jgi:hypothetical protein
MAGDSTAGRISIGMGWENHPDIVAGPFNDAEKRILIRALNRFDSESIGLDPQTVLDEMAWDWGAGDGQGKPFDRGLVKIGKKLGVDLPGTVKAAAEAMGIWGEEGAITFGGGKPGPADKAAQGILQKIAAGDKFMGKMHDKTPEQAQAMLDKMQALETRQGAAAAGMPPSEPAPLSDAAQDFLEDLREAYEATPGRKRPKVKGAGYSRELDTARTSFIKAHPLYDERLADLLDTGLVHFPRDTPPRDHGAIEGSYKERRARNNARLAAIHKDWERLIRAEDFESATREVLGYPDKTRAAYEQAKQAAAQREAQTTAEAAEAEHKTRWARDAPERARQAEIEKANQARITASRAHELEVQAAITARELEVEKARAVWEEKRALANVTPAERREAAQRMREIKEGQAARQRGRRKHRSAAAADITAMEEDLARPRYDIMFEGRQRPATGPHAMDWSAAEAIARDETTLAHINEANIKASAVGGLADEIVELQAAGIDLDDPHMQRLLAEFRKQNPALGIDPPPNMAQRLRSWLAGLGGEEGAISFGGEGGPEYDPPPSRRPPGSEAAERYGVRVPPGVDPDFPLGPEVGPEYDPVPSRRPPGSEAAERYGLRQQIAKLGGGEEGAALIGRRAFLGRLAAGAAAAKGLAGAELPAAAAGASLDEAVAAEKALGAPWSAGEETWMDPRSFVEIYGRNADGTYSTQTAWDNYSRSLGYADVADLDATGSWEKTQRMSKAMRETAAGEPPPEKPAPEPPPEKPAPEAPEQKPAPEAPPERLALDPPPAQAVRQQAAAALPEPAEAAAPRLINALSGQPVPPQPGGRGPRILGTHVQDPKVFGAVLRGENVGDVSRGLLGPANIASEVASGSSKLALKRLAVLGLGEVGGALLGTAMMPDDTTWTEHTDNTAKFLASVLGLAQKDQMPTYSLSPYRMAAVRDAQGMVGFRPPPEVHRARQGDAAYPDWGAAPITAEEVRLFEEYHERNGIPLPENWLGGVQPRREVPREWEEQPVVDVGGGVTWRGKRKRKVRQRTIEQLGGPYRQPQSRWAEVLD